MYVFINDKFVALNFFILKVDFFLAIMKLLINFGFLLFMTIIFVLFYFINP